ncbi:MAG TPA: Cof-type HAD-IIB family hydrolase [Atopobiaceae bacterium]|nr:Cof-type HAD-IIB family hydrolase [Atopobiaceae bacterium]
MKIVFCDLDDTFLSTEKVLIGRNMAALDELARRGIPFVPCTGRSLSGVEAYAELANHPAVRYAITSTGSAVYDLRTHQVIHACALGRERTLALYERVRDLDVTFDIFSDGSVISERWRYERLKGYRLDAPMQIHVLRSRTPVDLPVHEIVAQSRIVERVSIFNRMDDEGFGQGRRVKETVEAMEGLRWTSAHPACVEVVDGRCSKGEALSWLCDHLGIERSSSVAFGDSHNDLEMIGTAGIGIAMGNAEEAVKAAAAMVAPTNDEAGVAQVLADLMQVGV